MINAFINAGLSFLVLFLIFRPLEICYPANKSQRFFRPHWWADLCYLVGQYLFFNGAVLSLLGYSEHWVHAAAPARIREVVAGLNGWLQATLVIGIGDFLIYWGHRLQHRVGFLWRFHWKCFTHHGLVVRDVLLPRPRTAVARDG